MPTQNAAGGAAAGETGARRADKNLTGPPLIPMPLRRVRGHHRSTHKRPHRDREDGSRGHKRDDDQDGRQRFSEQVQSGVVIKKASSFMPGYFHFGLRQIERSFA